MAFKRKRIGTKNRMFATMPGDCEHFAAVVGEAVNVEPRFWETRSKHEKWHPEETFVIDLLTLRLRKRYMRHRVECGKMLRAHSSNLFFSMGRHRLMQQDFPELHRACSRIEGEMAGRFVVQLAKESGYVEACHPAVTVQSVWEERLV